MDDKVVNNKQSVIITNSISASYANTCIILTNNSNNKLICFGDDKLNIPLVPKIFKFSTSSVSVGHQHACALKYNEIKVKVTAKCWGSNAQGGLDIDEDLNYM